MAWSTKAWSVIAQATNDPNAMQITEELETLRRDVEQAFPDAWRFIRPGFDE